MEITNEKTVPELANGYKLSIQDFDDKSWEADMDFTAGFKNECYHLKKPKKLIEVKFMDNVIRIHSVGISSLDNSNLWRVRINFMICRRVSVSTSIIIAEERDNYATFIAERNDKNEDEFMLTELDGYRICFK